MYTACLSPTFLACAGAMFALGGRADAQTERVDIYVDDPRPVQAAVLSLISRHPVIITYEDPRYEFAGDIQDVTDRVRRSPNTPGKNRVLVPRGGLLQSSYEINRSTGAPVDVTAALASIVEAKNLNPVGGKFAIRQSGDVFHIIPSEANERGGSWVKLGSILDTPITLSRGEMNGYELVETILDKLAEASGADILGLSAERFQNAFFRYTGSIDAKEEPARDVLLRALHSISPRLTWMLNYDPSGRYYVFAVTIVAEKPRPPMPPEFVAPADGGPSPAETPRPARD